MSYKLNKDNKGFTIIEVLIVLAIAGLIMLIVFLAVPALQRNQRNTSRKNDVGRVGSVSTEFVTNNNGRLPVAGDRNTVQTSAGTLAQYSGNYLTIVTGADNTSPGLTAMRLYTGVRCDTTTSGAVTATNANTRQMAIKYRVESGSGGAGSVVCQDI